MVDSETHRHDAWILCLLHEVGELANNELLLVLGKQHKRHQPNHLDCTCTHTHMIKNTVIQEKRKSSTEESHQVRSSIDLRIRHTGQRGSNLVELCTHAIRHNQQ
jgi:hypothetical protein